MTMPSFGEEDGLVPMYEAALQAILSAITLDQAQGIAHAALVKEEYNGHLISPLSLSESEVVPEGYALIMADNRPVGIFKIDE